MTNLARAAQTASKPIHIDTPHLYMRTLTAADASERWAGWFDQPDVRLGLNLKAGRKTKADIVAYIATFDQRSNILLGIFDKANDLLVGLIDVEINWAIGRYLANTVVGEAEYRHRGVMLELSPPFREYFFEKVGLKVMTATVLATNKPIIGYLQKTGWTLNQTLKNHVRSHADGSPIDLCLYSITREAWNAWMAANPEALAAIRIAAKPR
jgi:RimJ/RimL family protein N-acetyltransferase